MSNVLGRVLKPAAVCLFVSMGFAQQPGADSDAQALVKQYCIACHSNQARTADLTLEPLLSGDLADHAKEWEQVVHRLRARQHG